MDTYSIYLAYEDVLDLNDLGERLEELNDLETSEWDDDDEADDVALRDLLSQSGYDTFKAWADHEGSTLVRDTHLPEYVEQYADDMGTEIPRWIVVDWKATAEDFSADLTSYVFDGVTYYNI